MATGVGIDPARIAQLTEREETHLNAETSGSARMYERSRKVMPGGVPSSYQVRDPHPIFLERGSGSKVWDVDGSEYRDFHNGFGSMVQGHAHPAIVRAVTERMPLGTHFAAVTEDSVVVAEELVQRWGLPKWRFTNSGSESTMDAIRLARAHTGRELVVKMEGSYHGHHDTVMVSIGIDIDDDAVGPANRPNSVPYGGGIPACTVAQTIPVPFNDADALDARLAELSGQVACVIMEPGMMNIGVVLPQDGYLAAVREITQKHGVLLIFDEVKTGITIAAGGAVERFGVTPDIVTLAKALAGGLPSGAIGGSEEVMASIEDGTVYQVGTYNGNPLSMAAARASFQEVMTPDAYAHLEHLNDRLHDGLGAIIEQPRLPGARDRPRRQGLHRVLARAGAQLPRLGAQDERPAQRAGLALQHEPRRLHDSRPRGGVDALGAARRRRHRPLHRRVRGARGRPDLVSRARSGGARRRARRFVDEHCLPHEETAERNGGKLPAGDGAGDRARCAGGRPGRHRPRARARRSGHGPARAGRSCTRPSGATPTASGGTSRASPTCSRTARPIRSSATSAPPCAASAASATRSPRPRRARIPAACAERLAAAATAG